MSKLFLVVVLGPFAFLINYSQLVFAEPIFTNSSLSLELLDEGLHLSTNRAFIDDDNTLYNDYDILGYNNPVS